MKRKLFFSISFLIIFLLSTFLFIRPENSVQADAGPGPNPFVSGVGPYEPQKTNVQMLYETVLIEIPAPNPSLVDNPLAKQIGVKAHFTMLNQSQIEETMQVVFPLTLLDVPWLTGRYDIVPSSFLVKIDGQPVSISEITTPPEMAYNPEPGMSVSPIEGKYYQDVRWAAFEVTFPVGEKVILDIEYNMFGYGGFTGITYIVETGAGWYGKILSADIIVKLPYLTSDEILGRGTSPGYSFFGNEIRWKRANFEPSREDNIVLYVADVDAWLQILELRTKLEEDSNNAELWFTLGQEYERLATFELSYYCLYPELGSKPPGYQVISNTLLGLSIEAYEQAISIRPDWDRAHVAYAYALWRGDEKVQKRYSASRVNYDIEIDSAFAERIAEELKLAWSSESSLTDHDVRYFSCVLLTYLDDAFPGLALTPPLTATPTMLPKTETPTPTLTPRPLPRNTATSTPTLLPVYDDELAFNANNGLFVSLLVLSGALGLGYWWLRKLKTKNNL